MARNGLRVHHVRAVAMYSPEFAVWERDLTEWRKLGDGHSRRPNWQLADLSLEALLEMGLGPFYTTCSTPLGRSGDPIRCWPDATSTGMPRDLSQWQDCVVGGLRHRIVRYGRAARTSDPAHGLHSSSRWPCSHQPLNNNPACRLSFHCLQSQELDQRV